MSQMGQMIQASLTRRMGLRKMGRRSEPPSGRPKKRRERRAVGIGDGGAYLKESKTDEARDATMPQSLAEILMQWRSQQGEPAETSYILTGTDRFMHPGTLCRQWKSVAELLGLKGSEGRRVTFHDLRHTWATVAVASGVDIKTVASNLGHANAAMTLNIYASADPDAKRHAASIMDGVI